MWVLSGKAAVEGSHFPDLGIPARDLLTVHMYTQKDAAPTCPSFVRQVIRGGGIHCPFVRLC